jgi:hypothetical protein
MFACILNFAMGSFRIDFFNRKDNQNQGSDQKIAAENPSLEKSGTSQNEILNEREWRNEVMRARIVARKVRSKDRI